MNKKVAKWVITIIFLVMLATILFFFLRNVPNPFTEENVWNSEEKKQNEMEQSETYDKSGSREHLRSQLYLPNDTNTAKVNEIISITEEDEVFSYKSLESDELVPLCMEYKVNQVQYTKDAVDSDAPYYASDVIQFDENYRILNEYSYVSISITIKNTGKSEEMISLDNYRYMCEDSTVDDKSNIVETEPSGYKTSADLWSQDKAYYLRVFQPDEEYTFNLVFIVADSAVNTGKHYLKFYPSGIVDGKIQYVEL